MSVLPPFLTDGMIQRGKKVGDGNNLDRSPLRRDEE